MKIYNVTFHYKVKAESSFTQSERDRNALDVRISMNDEAMLRKRIAELENDRGGKDR